MCIQLICRECNKHLALGRKAYTPCKKRDRSGHIPAGGRRCEFLKERPAKEDGSEGPLRCSACIGAEKALRRKEVADGRRKHHEKVGKMEAEAQQNVFKVQDTATNRTKASDMLLSQQLKTGSVNTAATTHDPQTLPANESSADRTWQAHQRQEEARMPTVAGSTVRQASEGRDSTENTPIAALKATIPQNRRRKKGQTDEEARAYDMMQANAAEKVRQMNADFEAQVRARIARQDIEGMYEKTGGWNNAGIETTEEVMLQQQAMTPPQRYGSTLPSPYGSNFVFASIETTETNEDGAFGPSQPGCHHDMTLSQPQDLRASLKENGPVSPLFEEVVTRNVDERRTARASTAAVSSDDMSTSSPLARSDKSEHWRSLMASGVKSEPPELVAKDILGKIQWEEE